MTVLRTKDGVIASVEEEERLRSILAKLVQHLETTSSYGWVLRTTRAPQLKQQLEQSDRELWQFLQRISPQGTDHIFDCRAVLLCSHYLG